MAIRSYKTSSDLINLQQPKNKTRKCPPEFKEYPKYNDLSGENKKIVNEYVKVRKESDELAFRMVQMVSSVQLVFYLTRPGFGKKRFGNGKPLRNKTGMRMDFQNLFRNL